MVKSGVTAESITEKWSIELASILLFPQKIYARFPFENKLVSLVLADSVCYVAQYLNDYLILQSDLNKNFPMSWSYCILDVAVEDIYVHDETDITIK